MPFFADTNVCSKWVSDPTIRQRWKAEKARLEDSGFEYTSCPLVLIELLSRLVKPEPQYFSEDIKSFLFLARGSDGFLPFPAGFISETILKTTSAITKLHPSDFTEMLQI